MLGKMHPLRFTSKKTLGLSATCTTLEKALVIELVALSAYRKDLLA